MVNGELLGPDVARDHRGLEPLESGMVFDAKAQRLTGTLDCP